MNDQQGAVPDRSAGCPSAAAFARYVEPEVPVLYRVALTMAAQPADAEDLVQDTLVRAYRAIDRFDGAHPRAWLLTILRNTHRNRARTRIPSLLREAEHDAGVLDRGGDTRSAEDIVVDAQFQAVVAEALAALPTMHRVVVQLVDVDGLSYAEAAHALGVPRGTVMSRLHRARRLTGGQAHPGPPGRARHPSAGSWVAVELLDGPDSQHGLVPETVPRDVTATCRGQHEAGCVANAGGRLCGTWEARPIAWISFTR